MTNENTTFRPLDSLQVMAYIVDMCRKQHIEVNVTKLLLLLRRRLGSTRHQAHKRIASSMAVWPRIPENS
jgi:hypothetical protein